MADTFSQVHLHFVFSPKFRASLIHTSWEADLHKYITGITRKNAHKMLAINGTEDHVHMLVGFQTTQSIAAFMQDVKADSSQWINNNRFCKTRFEWQAGYGVFSYSKSSVDSVIQYILNQKEHHRKVSFLDEYKLMLEKFGIDYKEEYLFKAPE
ncbi:IS200/IS605 family transposase [Dyadobacter chenhuakuii]|uniref:IS200/IS605 family transposase n=1 Tax=Dyadobacter chenhuakuii TaxID=2909339 RepID=A0A9X1QCK3_9BACT|nr:IS200/IS605 family transposase [Dyadobacter chenhuakuii]MCF2498621.1 IS200/IS605 family transposase [Dyadobacter chenhuakuii]